MSSCPEPKQEVLYQLDDPDAGEGHVPSPRADSLQEEAKRVGLLSMGPGPKVSNCGDAGLAGGNGPYPGFVMAVVRQGKAVSFGEAAWS